MAGWLPGRCSWPRGLHQTRKDTYHFLTNERTLTLHDSARYFQEVIRPGADLWVAEEGGRGAHSPQAAWFEHLSHRDLSRVWVQHTPAGAAAVPSVHVLLTR